MARMIIEAEYFIHAYLVLIQLNNLWRYFVKFDENQGYIKNSISFYFYLLALTLPIGCIESLAMPF